ncbi:MAG: hypothetical protein ABEJ80_05305 [Halarchaeum sp.]
MSEPPSAARHRIGRDRRTRTRRHRALGVAFLLLGWLPIAHGLALLGVPVPHVELPDYQPLTP